MRVARGEVNPDAGWGGSGGWKADGESFSRFGVDGDRDPGQESPRGAGFVDDLELKAQASCFLPEGPRQSFVAA